jgi:hypothetical protein
MDAHCTDFRTFNAVAGPKHPGLSALMSASSLLN